MASLIVDKVTCLEETTEVASSDNIYMIVFRGNNTPPFDSNLNVHAPQMWRSFDKNETVAIDRNIAQYVPGAAYIAMLVERDDGVDITGNITAHWRSQADLTWKAAKLAGASAGNAAQQVINTLKGLEGIFMAFPLGNDDSIATHQVTAAPGAPSNVVYTGLGGKYRVTFKVA